MAKSESRVLGTEYTGPMPEETILVRGEDNEIIIDVIAMMSNYECVYGDGCQGTEPWFGEGPTQKKFDSLPSMGCCRTAPSFLLDEHDTPDRMRPSVDALTIEDAENVKLIQDWWYKEDKDGNPSVLRQYKGNCVFLNSDEHENPGCSLWAHATRTGQRPQDIRPKICHTEPVMLIKIGQSEVTSRQILSLRPYWLGWFNPDAWYCTKDPSTYRATTPVFHRMREQISWLIDDKEMEEKVIAALDTAWEERGERVKREKWNQPVMLPTPVVWDKFVGERRAREQQIQEREAAKIAAATPSPEETIFDLTSDSES